jgi:hypothetical protein
MATPAAPCALQLPDLPREALVRILALACDTPAQLFAAGAACASLRAAAGCTDAALAPLWNRVMALLDPAGALARPRDFVVRDSEACAQQGAAYATHAHRLPAGWHSLAHALAARTCTVCGHVTRWVAHSETHGLGPLRCCTGCADELLAASGGSEDEAEDADPPLMFCVVLNAFLFEAEPVATLDGDALGGAAAAALQAAVFAASDGDTIVLRGAFNFAADDIMLEVSGERAVRLVGAPPAAPYQPAHGNFQQHAPRTMEELQLGQRERAAAAALAFPSASVHFATGMVVDSNCALWASNLRISGGNRTIGAINFWAWLNNQAMPYEAPCAAMAVDGGAAVVLQRCWVTGYNGSGIVARQRSCLALLQCAVTNTMACAVVCTAETTLRLRGCHVVCNCQPVSYYGDKQPPERERAVNAVNVVADNQLPGGEALTRVLFGGEPPVVPDVLVLT